MEKDTLIGNISSVQELMKERHSLIEWMVIMQKHPEIREEFEKLCPPKPIE